MNSGRQHNSLNRLTFQWLPSFPLFLTPETSKRS
jgi:hypothetical protein